MNNKSLIGMVAGAAAVLLLYFAIQQLLFEQPAFNNQLMEVANEVNKSCPIMVDSETRLDNAVALPGNVFQYHYTFLTFNKENIDISELEANLKTIILNNIKSSPDLKLFRENNVTMAYYYKDLNGNYLFKLVYEPDQYK